MLLHILFCRTFALLAQDGSDDRLRSLALADTRNLSSNLVFVHFGLSSESNPHEILLVLAYDNVWPYALCKRMMALILQP